MEVTAPEGRRSFQRTDSRSDDNTTNWPTDSRWVWNQRGSGQGPDEDSDEHEDENSSPAKLGTFIGKMGDNQLVKNNCAHGVTRQVTQLSDELAGMWKEESAYCRY